MKNKKNLISRAFIEFKNGWYLSKLPDHIEMLDKNIYVKLFKLIGAGCLFLIISDLAQQFNKLTFNCIFTFSFVYTLYRLVIVFYYLKQFIVNVFKGNLIVRNSPINSFNTIFKIMGNTVRTTANFGVGTGVAYCLCYELDEILINEGKEPYFVPGMRNMIRKIGLEDQATNFLNRVGIKDKINTNNSKSITDLLESMSEAERVKYESETGQSWSKLYTEQKKLQENMINSRNNKTSSISKTISEYIDKEDPFKTK